MTNKETLIEELEELKEEQRKLEDGENTDEYDEAFDCDGDVKIGGLSFVASRIVKELDPIAYRCGLSDFNDERLSKLETEIEDKESEIEEIDK